ncbi:hypothetical protein Prudu_021211 [Prunus dulcis]|uniref:Uncharacterized protein n=1 Tax=Prunus dulcis TaxID=3755 RepID=A0A4Y1RYJ3_PRUDU|nr:hypothetical protein Prudu_021211 [Prunus dulcis]
MNSDKFTLIDHCLCPMIALNMLCSGYDQDIVVKNEKIRCTSGTVYHFVSQKLKVFFLKVEQKRMAGEGSTVNWSMPSLFILVFLFGGLKFLFFDGVDVDVIVNREENRDG